MSSATGDSHRDPGESLQTRLQRPAGRAGGLEEVQQHQPSPELGARLLGVQLGQAHYAAVG